MKKKRRLLIILLLLLLVIICAVIALWHRRTPKSGDEKPDIEIDADEWNGEQPLDSRKQDVKHLCPFSFHHHDKTSLILIASAMLLLHFTKKYPTPKCGAADKSPDLP